jgi:hypothetical protein
MHSGDANGQRLKPSTIFAGARYKMKVFMSFFAVFAFVVPADNKFLTALNVGVIVFVVCIIFDF